MVLARKFRHSIFAWPLLALLIVANGLSRSQERWAELALGDKGKTGFTLLAPDETGILFTNTLDKKLGAGNRVLFNGSGVALGDYDGDGLPDIYFCSLNSSNILYKNLGGWKFTNVTAGSGIVCSNQFCRGAVFSDLNGDRKLDLLVATTGEGVLCFMNLGNGSFTNVTDIAGTQSKYGAVTMALADVDDDGTLDLYVANNRTDDIRDRGQIDIQMVNGKLVIPPQYTNRLAIIEGKLFEYGEPDIFYLNDGKGRFTPVSWTRGAFLDEDGKSLTSTPQDWALTVTFRDMNGDLRPDLYVCNDYWTPDRIWTNHGKGRFQAMPKLALRNTSASSMGVDFADVTRSGRMDFFVVDMLSRDLRLRKRQMFAQTPRELPIGAIDNRPQIMRNTLGWNRGDGTYAEVAEYAGLAASDWAWSPIFLDVDLDGFEDLLITAGHVKDVQDLDASAEIDARERQARASGPKRDREAFVQAKMENARLYPTLEMPIVAFRNRGDLTFEEVTEQWGTDRLGVHHAIATADLDADGDLDLVVNSLGMAAEVYRNDSSTPRVAVRLKGMAPNTEGIGGKVTLRNGAVPMQSQEVISGGRYMAGSEAMLVFAAGALRSNMQLEVKWRRGTVSVVGGVRANRIYEIDEAGSVRAVSPLDERKRPVTMFTDASNSLSHSHVETPFDDFARQPLLPRKLSQIGPGVVWADIDGDHRDDLIIGSGKGGRIAAFRNTAQGTFERIAAPPWDALVTRDQTGLLAWERSAGETLILAGSANYEDGLPVGNAVRQYSYSKRAVEDLISANPSSVGPLAMADIEGDGDLDLFVGGRVIAGRYPEPASSYIYRSNKNHFTVDSENSRALARIGMVSGAIWADLDNDGLPELILACESGPLRVFSNRSGQLEEATARLRFDQLSGSWTSVNVGDFDGDGLLDLVAGNWGLNTPYVAQRDQPSRLYFGNFSGNGFVDLIESQFDPALRAEVPRRGRDPLLAALPDLRERFPSHRAFSETTLPDLLGGRLSSASHVQATVLATSLFLNRRDHFKPAPLPREAQLAPVFGVCVTDFNADGHEDLFLSQNFFAYQPEVARSDAGRGLLLLGDGKGGMRAIPGQESGIQIYGEQRGAALSDYDRDGRVDLVVAQNGAETKLFRNRGAEKGVRVRLIGDLANPTAVGAAVRLRFTDGLGPVRQISAGSGYLSQDSAVHVFAGGENLTGVIVRWPGGKTTETPIGRALEEITVNYSGKLLPQGR